MRRFIWAIALCVGLLVSGAAPSQAEPYSDTWRCASAWEWRTIYRSDYYSCPFGQIVIYSGYTGKMIRKLDGMCANQLWVNTSHKATWQDAWRKCTIWVA